MFKSITDKAEREEGFTLIELMVVVLIIGILMAIAIPTFLGAKNSANARAAQSNVRNAITAEQTQFSSGGAYSNVAATMQPLEQALAWAGGAVPTKAANNISIWGDAANNVFVQALGTDTKCYTAWDSNGQVFYNQAASCVKPASTFAWYASWSDANSGTNALSGTTTPALPTFPTTVAGS